MAPFLLVTVFFFLLQNSLHPSRNPGAEAAYVPCSVNLTMMIGDCGGHIVYLSALMPAPQQSWFTQVSENKLFIYRPIDGGIPFDDPVFNCTNNSTLLMDNAVRVQDLSTGACTSLGQFSTQSWLYDVSASPALLQISYRGPDGVVSTAVIKCSTNPTPTFSFVNESPRASYNFALTYACICPDSCGAPVPPPPSPPPPSGPPLEYVGSFTIVPYSFGSSSTNPTLQCTTCDELQVPSQLFIYDNGTITFTVSKASSSKSCLVASTSLVFQPSTQTSTGFQGQIQFSSIKPSLPACLVYDPSSGAVALNLNSSNCPSANIFSRCVNNLNQIWAGSFIPAGLIAGNYSGQLNFPLFNQGTSSFSCNSKCPLAPAAVVAYVPSPNSMAMTLEVTQSGCSFPTSTFSFTNITDYGATYPDYFSASFTYGSFSIPKICFYFDDNGNFVLKLDGSSTCPYAGATPQCTTGGFNGVSVLISGNLYPDSLAKVGLASLSSSD